MELDPDGHHELEGVPGQQFSAEDCVNLYTIVFRMCTQSRWDDYRQRLYDMYKESIEEYMTTTVLPALRQEHEDSMLRELVKRWQNHKLMMRWLFKFFEYLDRSFLQPRSLPSLEDVALMCFRDQVYEKMKNNVRDSMVTLIHRDRENERIDRSLLNNVLGFLVEISMGTLDEYEADFEPAILNDAATYYARQAALWARESSAAEYDVRVEESLESERGRVRHYLYASSEDKLLERIRKAMFYDRDDPSSESEQFESRSTSPDIKLPNTTVT